MAVLFIEKVLRSLAVWYDQSSADIIADRGDRNAGTFRCLTDSHFILLSYL